MKLFKAIRKKFRFRKTFAEMSEAKMTPDLHESGVSSSEAETLEAFDVLAAEKNDLSYRLKSSSATLCLKPLAEISRLWTVKNDPLYTDSNSNTDSEDELSEGKGKEVVYRRPR